MKTRMMKEWALLGLLFASLVATECAQLLSETPFIVAHDAGTTYLKDREDPVEVLDWTRTQPEGGFSKLLDCGVRGFDARPEILDDGRIVMHHGPISEHVSLQQALEETQKWSMEVNGGKDVVLFYFSHFDSDLKPKIMEILQMQGVHVLPESCSKAANTNYADALAMGPLLALFGCVDENFDPSVQCEDFAGVCFHDRGLQKKLRKMRSYLDSTLEKSRSDRFWMLQGHWQTSPESISIGTLFHSSILKDNSRSKVNFFIANYLNSTKPKLLGFIELDNVCDGGKEVAEVLKDRLASSRSKEAQLHLHEHLANV